MTGDRPTVADCRREIVGLHDFFVTWYTDITAESDFQRLTAALGEGFELVTPAGDTMSREAVVKAIRGSRGQYYEGGFDIEIRNVTLTATSETVACARYEEWQSTPETETGRVSSVVFGVDPETPEGLRWDALQETWLSAPE